MQKNNKYSLNEDFFKEINTEEKAYWLGFLMADGCILDAPKRSKRLVLALKGTEIDQLKRFKKSIKSNSKIHKFIIRTGNVAGKEVCKIALTSENLCQDLINLGCTPRKSLTLKFPKIDDKLVHHFIRGYFDGDGSVFISKEKHHRSKKINKVIYVDFTSTEDFLKVILEKTKIGTIKCIKKAKGKSFNYRVKRNPRVKLFYEYLYQDASIYLKRKKAIFDNYFK